MGTVFLKLFNMAVSASWLILAVLAVRLFFKRAPKWVICLMWGLVAVRLICPFSVESKMSILPSGETIPQNIAMERKPQIESGFKVIDEAVNPVIEYNFSPQISDSVNPLQVIQFVSGVNVSSDTDTGVPYAIGPNETRVIAYVTDEDPEFNVYTRPVSGGPVRITMIDGDASETAEFPVQSSDQAVYFYPTEDETKPGTVVIVKGTAGPRGSAGTLHITGD